MLEVVVGALAAVLVLAGIAVILGPALPRFWRGAWPLVARVRRPAEAGFPLPPPVAETGIHPTTMRALGAAARAYGLLRAQGEERLAFQLRAAARLVRSDEGRGLVALGAVLRSMRDVALRDDEADLRYRRLLRELREAVRDRAEQLELLHFR